MEEGLILQDEEPAKLKDNVNKVGILEVAEQLHQVRVGHRLVKPAHETGQKTCPKDEPS